MSTIELKEKLRVLPRDERREMMLVLQELEALEEAAPAAVLLVSLEDAKAYLYKNCDGLLHRLAQ